MSFKKVEDDVREILKYNQAARCDDMKLYANYVYSKLSKVGTCADWLTKVFSDKRFRIIHGIAPYETVSRVRRKLQEEFEELKAPEYMIKEKKEQEKAYKLYAKGVKE